MAKITSSESSGTQDAKDTSVAHLKFEAALGELEKIVRSMEDEQLPLETSIAAYRRGSELLGHCQHLLKEAEHKVQILENGVLRDFDIANGES